MWNNSRNMKVVVINGSPRTNGFTAILLHGIEADLKEKNVDVEYFDLSKIAMAQCAGCCSCYKTGRCYMNDDAELLSQKIGEADGLVLGSPTYASNVSGYMKAFIDRGHFVIEQLLTAKKCVTVATGENYGNRDTRHVLNNLVIYSGGRLAKSIALNAPFNSIHSLSQEYQRLTRQASNCLYNSIAKKKKYLFQSFFHKIIFSLGIRPFVVKKGKAYEGVLNKWKSLGIYE